MSSKLTQKRIAELEREALDEVIALTGGFGGPVMVTDFDVRPAPPTVDSLSPPSQAAYRIRVAELLRAAETSTPAPSTDDLQQRGIMAYARERGRGALPPPKVVRIWIDGVDTVDGAPEMMVQFSDTFDAAAALSGINRAYGLTINKDDVEDAKDLASLVDKINEIAGTNIKLG